MFYPSSNNQTQQNKLSLNISNSINNDTKTKDSSYYISTDNMNSSFDIPLSTPTKSKDIDINEFTPIKLVRNNASKTRRNMTYKPIPFNINYEANWRLNDYDIEDKINAQNSYTGHSKYGNKSQYSISNFNLSHIESSLFSSSIINKNESIIKHCVDIISDINTYKDYDDNISIYFINTNYQTTPIDKDTFFRLLSKINIDSNNPIIDNDLIYFAGSIIIFDCNVNEYIQLKCRLIFCLNDSKITFVKIEIINN